MKSLKRKLEGKFLDNLGNIISAILILVVVAVVVIGVVSKSFFTRIAKQVGETTGNAVGAAIGSLNGITVGLSEGKAAGIHAGLSAEDTTVDIKGHIEKIGRLEVLSAGVELKNDHTVGKEYAALYVLKGKAYFTVDLSEMTINFDRNSDEIAISIPSPELYFEIDENETKKIAEYQKFSFSGDAETGFDAYINSMAVASKKADEVISNYDMLNERAKESALKQTKMIVENMCGNDKKVKVNFQ